MPSEYQFKEPLPPFGLVILKSFVMYIKNSLHLAEKYAGILVHGHYLFREVSIFLSA